jgi:hypothetical protein
LPVEGNPDPSTLPSGSRTKTSSIAPRLAVVLGNAAAPGTGVTDESAHVTAVPPSMDA